MPVWFEITIPTLLSSAIGLQFFILKKLMDHEKQLYRLVSDRESEKRTIASVHSDIESRLRTLEREIL